MLVLALVLVASMLPAAASSSSLCQLKGRVRVVGAHATYRVQEVSSFPDLRVKRVTSLPMQPGEWQFVTSGEDFTIQWVTSAPDLRVQLVEAFPGCSSQAGEGQLRRQIVTGLP